jgi:hypothetical protein
MARDDYLLDDLTRIDGDLFAGFPDHDVDQPCRLFEVPINEGDLLGFLNYPTLTRLLDRMDLDPGTLAAAKGLDDVVDLAIPVASWLGLGLVQVLRTGVAEYRGRSEWPGQRLLSDEAVLAILGYEIKYIYGEHNVDWDEDRGTVVVLLPEEGRCQE